MVQVLGTILPLPENIDTPCIILFKSTFCARCLWNRQILKRYVPSEVSFLEIDISSSSPLLSIVQPPSVPYAIVVDQDRKAVSIVPGTIFPQQAKIIGSFLEKLVKGGASITNQA